MSGLKRLHAPLAWVDGRWQADVLLSIENGHWHSVEPACPRRPMPSCWPAR